MFKKRYKIIITIAGVFFFLLVIVGVSWLFDFGKNKKPVWGVTFSQIYAEDELKLNWRETYEAILNDLRPQKIRLIAYWKNVEKEEGKYYFEDLDWQIKLAEERGIEVVLVVGHRVPRWPECHHPGWTENLPEQELRESLLNYIAETINHYKSFSIIESWQVENEPLFLLFGNCPRPDWKFLKQEIELVKSLDPERPIIITDSGELSLWIGSAGASEIFGTTLYRVIWSKYIGWFKHFYSPASYTFRGWLVTTFTPTKKIIISELQAEPWGEENKSIADIPIDEQVQHFSAEEMKNNCKFARKTGLEEAYLWGVEWWYWRKTKGDDNFWNAGRDIISGK